MITAGQVNGRLTAVAPAEDRAKHWVFRCECGALKTIASYSVERGATKSCGCLRREANGLRLHRRNKALVKQPGEAGLNIVYGRYQRQAANRSLKFELSRTQFSRLIRLPCHYCGRPPSQVSRSADARCTDETRNNGQLTHNGVDRADNRLGYVTDNCVPCCGDCNRVKCDWTSAELVEWVERFARFQNLNIFKEHQLISDTEILMGRQIEFPLTEDARKNLKALMRALNGVRSAYGKPMVVTSGYRPGRFNTAAGGAKASCHLTCQACDFADADGALAAWCLANLPVLEKYGLWMESPAHTKGWVHLQTRPVANRVFIP